MKRAAPPTPLMAPLDPAPVLLAVARMGEAGEVVVPEPIRGEWGLSPGRTVLFVRTAHGLMLVDAGRARGEAESTLAVVREMRNALGRNHDDR